LSGKGAPRALREKKRTNRVYRVKKKKLRRKIWNARAGRGGHTGLGQNTGGGKKKAKNSAGGGGGS